MTIRALPRVLFAAPHSGGGKTTVVCGMLEALKRRGLSPAGYKCGPDYIDPMFHRKVLGTPSYNLDLFFTSEEMTCGLLATNASDADIAILEGVMGFYDGLGGSRSIASAWHLARTTQTPVVLICDAKGAALSLAAVVRGFLDLRPDNRIAGVILNRASASAMHAIAPLIESECGIPVFGCLPDREDFTLESRHLGLVSAGEIADLQVRIGAIADALMENVDIDAIVKVARTAPEMEYEPIVNEPIVSEPVRIAVAWDSAFCFYYEENLSMLTDLGAEVVRFSPIADAGLPEGCAAIYLGGGYPELSAAALAQNVSMRIALKEACENGMPVFAECGGFLYLQETLTDLEGNLYPMVGALEGHARYTGRLTRFGYVELDSQQANLICEEGDVLPAHEFHYYDSDNNGDAFVARKPFSSRSWPCFQATDNIVAGFPHIYFPACPTCAQRLVGAAVAYRNDSRRDGRG